MTPSPLERLLTSTSGGPILLDGGIGTLLLSGGGVMEFPSPGPAFRYNFLEPEKVVAAHLSFLEAGSEILLANSFCASRPFLDGMDFSTTVEEANRLAVRLARAAIEKYGRAGILVAGSIGPLPPGLSTSEQYEIHLEQSATLAAAGVDILVCETFLDCKQLTCAAEACREAAVRVGHAIPVVGSLVPHGLDTVSGITLLRKNGLVDLIGLNCGAEFDYAASMIQALSAQSPGPFWFKPSCGTPVIRQGVLEYPVSPQLFAQGMASLSMSLPLSAIGGCCGASPEHIRMLEKMIVLKRTRVPQ